MDRGKRSQKSSSKYWCVVPGCTSDSRKKTNLEKYPWMENNVTFIPFPTKLKDHRLRSKWIEMIRRPLCYQPLPRLILLVVPCDTTMSEFPQKIFEFWHRLELRLFHCHFEQKKPIF